MSDETERLHVATRLHDDVIQVMYGAAFMLEALARRQTDPALAGTSREIAADLIAAGERLTGLMRELQRP
jgi:signal transduction histidine kinase